MDCRRHARDTWTRAGRRTQEATSGRRLGHGFDDAPRRCADRHCRPRRPAGGPRPTRSDSRFPFRISRILVKITISPDGRWLAFTAATDVGTALFLRRFESTTPELLSGTDGAASPFWSPDSREIAFFSGGRIKKISVTGGPVQIICNAPNLAGGTWNSDGVIVFSSAGVLNRTISAGGEARPISVRDDSKQETGHLAPVFLPDGKRYFYPAWSPLPGNSAVYLASLDSNDRTKLLVGQSKAVYRTPAFAVSQTGDSFCPAVRLTGASLTGEPMRVADEIFYDALNAAGGVRRVG